MKLREIYAQPGFQLSFEFFPPKTEKGLATLGQEIECLKTYRPSFCSVTYGAGGGTRDRTVSLVDTIHHRYALDVMCHLTVVNQSKDEVRGVLRELAERGIENIIALRGDPPGGTGEWVPHPDGFLYSVELVREARALGDFSIAVAGFPETHPRAESREADLRYLKEKVDAGADAVITQLFFDNEDFYRYAEDVAALGVTVPVVPGVLPIQSTAQTTRFTALCGSRIPERLGRLLEGVADDDEAAVALGIEYATAQCQDLIDFGVPAVHFYTLNKSRSVAGILTNLGLVAQPLAAG
ncbi:MAG: methylenetetrahydrofolate reductase [NAD(P)H] [Acidimicrobiia bacterium]